MGITCHPIRRCSRLDQVSGHHLGGDDEAIGTDQGPLQGRLVPGPTRAGVGSGT